MKEPILCPMCGFKLERPRKVDWNGVVGYSYRCKTENRIIWIQVVPYEWKKEKEQ